MDENQIFEILSSYKTVIDGLLEKVSNLEEAINQGNQRVSDLEEVLFDDILAPAKEAFDNARYEDEFNQFNEKYGERLGAYDDKLKAVEGEDFSLAKEAFDGYKNFEGEAPDQDVYVDTLVSKVEEQLNAIKEAFGAEDVTAEIDADGNVEIEADGEPVDVEDEPEEEIEEEPTDEDEMAAFQAELDAEMEKK